MSKLGAAALAAALMASTAGLAQAADLSLKNISEDYSIAQLYVTPASLQDWGPNRVAGGPIDPGGTVILSGMPAGTYDMKLVSLKGDTCMLKAVDFGKAPMLNFDGATCIASMPGDHPSSN